MALDLSAVTDTLLDLLKSQWGAAPIWTELGSVFTPGFTGLAPDIAFAEGSPQLGLYLYHIESDTATESLFWQPQVTTAGGEPTRFLPLALDLFYLLFAYSETSYQQEQEAMSVALRIFHANPIVRSEPGTVVPWELTLTMEHRSYDELSRLWQATTVPLRMSLVYRAAVVFIDPDQMPDAAPNPTAYTIAADPAQLPPPAQGPALLGTFSEGSYQPPAGQPVPYSHSPAVVAAGQTAWLLGSGLGTPGNSDSVYLLPPGGTEIDVTAWTVPAQSSAAKVVLTLPSATGTPPAGAPAPGRYQLRAGSGAAGSAGAVRTAPVAVDIAAFVSAAAGPVLAGSAPFTVTGTGFTAGATQVLMGTTALTEVASSPAAGQFSVAPGGTSLTFAPPPGQAGTTVQVRVLVSGVESEPALWVTL